MKTESLSRIKKGIPQSPIIISGKRKKNGTIGDELRYKNLVESMGNGISEIDHNGVSTYANDTTCELWGYRRRDIIGRKVSGFLDRSNLEILNKQLSKRRSGGCESYELTWTRKDGQKVHTVMTPTPYFESDGRFLGSFAVITDISFGNPDHHWCHLLPLSRMCFSIHVLKSLWSKIRSVMWVNLSLLSSLRIDILPKMPSKTSLLILNPWRL